MSQKPNIRIVKNIESHPDGEMFEAALELENGTFKVNANGERTSVVTVLAESASREEVEKYLFNLGLTLIDRYRSWEDLEQFDKKSE